MAHYQLKVYYIVMSDSLERTQKFNVISQCYILTLKLSRKCQIFEQHSLHKCNKHVIISKQL